MAEGNSVEGSGHPRQRKRPKKVMLIHTIRLYVQDKE